MATNTQITFKNVSANTLTYQGQSISPGGTYTPGVADQSTFASDPGIIADVLSDFLAITVGTNIWSGLIALEVLRTVQTLTILASPLPASGSKFSFGDITLASSTTQAAVMKTTYTEQNTNGQRSIASSNVNDASAGTGARTIQITYYDQTMAGPYTEILTLNGTTGVNTVGTNICYIENIKVLTVGSSNANLGTLTLFTAINKGGTTIGTIAIGDNQTLWAIHYVPTGKTCYISGFSVNNNSTAAGNGAVFVIKAFTPTVANAVETQISDFHRIYGQSSTSTRNYGSPIQVIGPARILAYVTPEANTSTVFRASFDFIDN